MTDEAQAHAIADKLAMRQMADEIERLLADREAMLAALKAVASSGSLAFYSDTRTMVRDAIARVEDRT